MEAIDFKNIRSQARSPIGTTIIDHKIRFNLGLTLAEYCMMSLIVDLKIKKKPVDYDRIEIYLGFSKEQAMKILKSLLEKEFIQKHETGITVTVKWTSSFLIDDSEFEEFLLNKDTGKMFWTGSRKDIREKYILARRHYSHEHLMKQKYWYQKLLEHPEMKFRNVMGGSVWLNLKTERFNEDWKEQYQDLVAKSSVTEKKPKESGITSEDKQKMYQ